MVTGLPTHQLSSLHTRKPCSAWGKVNFCSSNIRLFDGCLQCSCSYHFHEALLTWYTGIWDSYKIGLYCIVEAGSSKLLIAGQELEVIAAPICAPLQLAVYWN